MPGQTEKPDPVATPSPPVTPPPSPPPANDEKMPGVGFGETLLAIGRSIFIWFLGLFSGITGESSPPPYAGAGTDPAKGAEGLQISENDIRRLQEKLAGKGEHTLQQYATQFITKFDESQITGKLDNDTVTALKRSLVAFGELPRDTLINAEITPQLIDTLIKGNQKLVKEQQMSPDSLASLTAYLAQHPVTPAPPPKPTADQMATAQKQAHDDGICLALKNAKGQHADLPPTPPQGCKPDGKAFPVPAH